MNSSSNAQTEYPDARRHSRDNYYPLTSRTPANMLKSLVRKSSATSSFFGRMLASIKTPACTGRPNVTGAVRLSSIVISALIIRSVLPSLQRAASASKSSRGHSHKRTLLSVSTMKFHVHKLTMAVPGLVPGGNSLMNTFCPVHMKLSKDSSPSTALNYHHQTRKTPLSDEKFAHSNPSSRRCKGTSKPSETSSDHGTGHTPKTKPHKSLPYPSTPSITSSRHLPVLRLPPEPLPVAIKHNHLPPQITGNSQPITKSTRSHPTSHSHTNTRSKNPILIPDHADHSAGSWINTCLNAHCH